MVRTEALNFETRTGSPYNATQALRVLEDIGLPFWLPAKAGVGRGEVMLSGARKEKRRVPGEGSGAWRAGEDRPWVDAGPAVHAVWAEGWEHCDTFINFPSGLPILGPGSPRLTANARGVDAVVTPH